MLIFLLFYAFNYVVSILKYMMISYLLIFSFISYSDFIAKYIQNQTAFNIIPVITGCGDGVIRCYDAKSGYLLRTFGHTDENSHPGAIMSLQMSGEKIFSATTDGIVRAFKIDWEFVR